MPAICFAEYPGRQTGRSHLEAIRHRLRLARYKLIVSGELWMNDYSSFSEELLDLVFVVE